MAIVVVTVVVVVVVMTRPYVVTVVVPGAIVGFSYVEWIFWSEMT